MKRSILRRLVARETLVALAWCALAAGAIALSLVADVQLGQATARSIAGLQAGPDTSGQTGQPHP